MTTAPITLRWRSQDVRTATTTRSSVSTPRVISWLRSAMAITPTAETLSLVLPRATGYDVRVLDYGSEVRLRKG